LCDKAQEIFWLLKRYQYQWESILPTYTQAFFADTLQEVAGEMGLDEGDLEVQRQIYWHCVVNLKGLPPLICRPECLGEGLDPALLSRYEQAVTLNTQTLQDIFGQEEASQGDACITLAKLAYTRRDNVLIRPMLPGQHGSLIASPTLLLNSILFRFAMLLAMLQ